jgi:nucleoside 2-deoxyribosyltransferase
MVRPQRKEPTMNIYVASSWRNDYQPEVVKRLKAEGHEVYDFKNPSETRHGFHWSEVDHNWQEWTPEQLRASLQTSPIAQEGFDSDWNAMKAADACVMVMPCGRSAHLEAGYFIGANKPCIILLTKSEPELMYKMATAICLDMDEVVAELKKAIAQVWCNNADAPHFIGIAVANVAAIERIDIRE